MKTAIYIIIFFIGLILTIYSSINWGMAGFPFSLDELSMALSGNKPWYLSDQSYFFFIILGVLVSSYAAFELNLKRWKKRKPDSF